MLKDNKIKSLVLSTGSWDGIYKIANWSGLKDNNNIRVINKPPFSIYAESISEKKGLEKMIKKINENKHQFYTYYTHNIDNTGHMYGHHPNVENYNISVKYTDDNIKGLFKLIKKEKKYNEDWLVLITTDHGGSSRYELSKTKAGREYLIKFDNNIQINAGIAQNRLNGIHGFRNDDNKILDQEQTKTFIIMKYNHMKYKINYKTTNKDISPTIYDFLVGIKDKTMFDGKSLLKK